MCGLAGILGGERRPEDSAGIVSAMLDRLAHRGPDGSGIHHERGATLGHRRLAIIDLQGGAQPMRSKDRRYTLIFNGVIYNYIELRERLTSRGVRFATTSDTEVLLELLIAEGRDAVRQLNGMFAFAFLDSTTGEWLLARDPFGIKPLYYALAGDEIVFASEIKALFCHPAVRPQAAFEALGEYLTLQFCLDDATMFSGVRKVEPGHYIHGRGGRANVPVHYWDLSYEIDDEITEGAGAERLLHLLEDSARLEIRSDVPLGAYLSGGVDSTAIAALAARQLGRRLPVFVGRFDDGAEFDESAYARIAAAEIGADVHEIVPTAQQFVDELPGIIYMMDEPVAGPGVFPQFMVSREASRHVKVVLGGQGGDEMFGGYARYLLGYLEQAIKGAMFHTGEEGRHVVTLESIVPNLSLLREYAPLMQHFWRDGLFSDMDARYFRLIDRSPDLHRLLNTDVRSKLDSGAVFEKFRAVFNRPDTLSYINKMTHFDMKTLLPALLQVEDRAGMASSIESRVPLLDTRIAELVARMPPRTKFGAGRSKHIFKKAVAEVVPRAILDREDKMGFPVPLDRWMARGPVREFVSDTLLGRASRERGIFEPRAVEQLIASEQRFGRQLWGVLCVELWHQKMIDHA